jgi:glycosyltransferase involved in cell wall biosynthesis
LVVHQLAEGLVARGHQVTLIATADSSTRARLVHHGQPARWPPSPLAELEHAALAIQHLTGEAAGEIDVVHVHTPSMVALSCLMEVPVVYTVHHGPDPALAAMYQRNPHVDFIAISHRQRTLLPRLPRCEVVHHGLDPADYPAGRGQGPLVFLGRFSEEKGVHLALDVAWANGWPIRLAGRVHEQDRAYFNAEVAPRLRRAGPQAEMVGEANHRTKLALLGEATALLCPVQWEEPFGLAYLEAMLVGTPVVALARGSLPELVTPGVTGFLCRDAAEMIDVVGDAGRLDRQACRRAAVRDFHVEQMLRRYELVYRRAMAAARGRHAAKAPMLEGLRASGELS